MDADLITVIRKALLNIRAYHEKQKRTSWFDTQENGTLLGQKVTPLAVAGVYVPGGKAAYPSLGADEYRSGESSRCQEDYYDDTVRGRRQGQSGRSGGSKRSGESMRSIR